MRGRPKKTKNNQPTIIEIGQFQMCAKFYKQLIELKQQLEGLKEAIEFQSDFNLKLTDLERTEFSNLRWNIGSIFETLTRFVSRILTQAETIQEEQFRAHADQVRKEAEK